MPKWKQAAAVACAVYAGMAWVVPVFMLPFVNVLPLVQDRTFIERLPFSVVGSVLVVVTLVVLNRGRIPSNAGIHATGRERLVHRLGEIGGLVMFTLIGAALSANTLGLVAKALPSEEFETVVVVREVDHQGSRYRSVSLEYAELGGGPSQHLTLSKRLFDYPQFEVGDVVHLRGEETAIGVYITGFALANAGATGR